MDEAPQKPRVRQASLLRLRSPPPDAMLSGRLYGIPLFAAIGQPVFVLPIPGHEEFRTWERRAPITWSVVALNVLVFVLTLTQHDRYLTRGAFVPAAPTAITAITSMFIHAGWAHIIGNMFFLVVFGRPVEHAIGSVKFGLGYVMTGFAALAVHSAVTVNPAMPVVGASGAISGVVGMFLALFPRAPVDLHAYFGYWHVRTWRSTGLVATGVWFIEQFALALLSSVTGLGLGIAFWAHVGGFLCGVILGFIASRLNVG